MKHSRLSLAFLLLTPLAAFSQAAPTLLASNNLPDAPQPTFSSSTSSLPEAPEPQRLSHMKTSQPATATVNGRPYAFPTKEDEFQAYEHELLSTRTFLHAAIRAALQQSRPNPVGWGQDFPGYLQRFGDAYGEAAISNTVRLGMGLALHEDNRYLICHHCSVGGKLKNAALAEFTARHGDDGHRTLSPTPIAASLAGPLVAYNTWYPEDEKSTKLGLRHVVFNVSTRVIFNAAREFLFDRDTPEEKAEKRAKP